MTERIFCQFCGTQLRHTARYCKGCGGRVDEYYEDAIILPITRELPREQIEEFEMGSDCEVVPISHASLPTLVESPAPLQIPRQTVISGDELGSGPMEKPVRADTPAHNQKRITLGIPLLMLAVILLFVLSYFATK